jgi:hypothetical protein
MTEEQFNSLPEQLQIWALRDNAVIYVEVGIIPSPSFTNVVKIALELSRDYPHIMHKNLLKKYSNVQISTLVNFNQ